MLFISSADTSRVSNSTFAVEGGEVLRPLDLKVAGRVVSTKTLASFRISVMKRRSGGRDVLPFVAESTAGFLFGGLVWFSSSGWVGSSEMWRG